MVRTNPAKEKRSAVPMVRTAPARAKNPLNDLSSSVDPDQVRASLTNPTLMALSFFGTRMEALLQKCYDMAMEGDVHAMRICMDRVAPVIKERPIPPVAVGAVRTLQDVPVAMERILKEMSQGVLTPSEGQLAVNMLKTIADTIKDTQSDAGSANPADFAARLRQAEHEMDMLSAGGPNG